MSCHICIYWTPTHGCAHYEPSESITQKVKEIVAHAHGGNYNIVETTDFIAGVNAALAYEGKQLKLNQLNP